MSDSIRIIEMPDLGTVDDTSSVVGERAGSGRFQASALRSYVLASVPARSVVADNLIHNATFTIQQRGIGPFATAFAYTADRWVSNFTGDTVSTTLVVLADADRAATGDEAATWGLLNQVTGTSGAGSFTQLAQRIEGVRRLSGKQIIVSFWAKANSGAPGLGVSIDQIFGTGGSPSASVSGNGQAVTLTNAFVRYTLSFTVPSAAGKTTGTAGGDYTQLNFWYSSGATNNARAGNIGVQSPSIVLWGVQLEVAQAGQTQPLPLAERDPADSLALCQRFYQIGADVTTSLYGPTGFGMVNVHPFPVVMRAAPAVTQIISATTNCTSGTPGATAYAISIIVNVTATGAASFTYSFTASADL